jgi:ComF family protein
LLPDRCLSCGETITRPEGRGLRRPAGWCARCAAAVIPLGAPFCLDCGGGAERTRCAAPGHLRLRAALQYGDEVAALVGAVKYRRMPELLDAWAEAWTAAGPARPPRVDLLVPVPAHPARVRERGLDVVGAWSARLGRLEAVPVARALERRRATPPQVGRERAQRRANVAGAFAAGAEAAAVRGRRVAVVDDVVTTGATVRACASLVAALGARDVAAWALAYEPLE